MKLNNLCFYLLLAGGTVQLAEAQTKKPVAKKPVTTQKATTSKTSTTTKPVTAFTLKTEKDSLSYALAVDITNNLKKSDLEINQEAFIKGMNDVLKGQKTIFDENQNMEVIQSSVKKIMDKKTEVLKKDGVDFLAKNKLKPTVKTTAEGIQYEVLQEGDGAQPTADDEVKVHYTGTLIDGTKFDSSYDRNEPLTLNLNRVIEGWKIGIPLMKVGSKYKFYIPYNLAYGERATGSIPAYSALIFEVELLGIEAK